jgi:hypothetical protein
MREAQNYSNSLFYFRQNTYFHEKLMLPTDTDIPGKITIREDSLPSKEFKDLFRITSLTRVVLDQRIITKNPIPGMTLLASSDMPEVTFARRTLYE